jgi:hypothetical protein
VEAATTLAVSFVMFICLVMFVADVFGTAIVAGEERDEIIGTTALLLTTTTFEIGLAWLMLAEITCEAGTDDVDRGGVVTELVVVLVLLRDELRTISLNENLN